MNRRSPGEEVFHQVEHPVTDAGNVDADVLDVEALAQLLDLLGLVRERCTPPAVLLKDSELAARLQGRSDDDTRRVVTGPAGVVPEPDRAVVERARAVRVVVGPEAEVGIAALQVRQGEGGLGAVDELAHVQLFEALFVALQAQLVDVEQVAAASLGIEQGNDLAPLPIRAQRAGMDLRIARPVLRQFLAALAVAERFPVQKGYAWWVTALGVEK